MCDNEILCDNTIIYAQKQKIYFKKHIKTW